MAPERARSTLEKFRIKRTSSRPTSKALSEAETAVASVTSGTADVNHPDEELAATAGPRAPISPSSYESTESRRNSVKTTNSSPTDPAYVPNKSGTGGHLLRSLPLKAIPRSPMFPINVAGTSFFDFDTESEEEEAVVGRASSVRMSRPNIIEQKPTVQEHSGHMIGEVFDKKQHTPSLASSLVTEKSETVIGETGNDTDQATGSRADALRALNGRQSGKSLHSQSHSISDRELMNDQTNLANIAKRGGLYMNPVTGTEKSSIQRAISAPSRPLRSPSEKKVKIRPSDIITDHSKESSRMFRESVVSTPYPPFGANDEKATEEEFGEDEEPTALPRKSGMLKSARFENDRFPSPDRPEVLFLTLGLANHPCATTTLEIRIIDKSTYDDEMLFRQIRNAYRGRLLGTSRFAFQLIRGVSYATVSPSLQYDFKWKEFMRHLENPRIGRKRKSWIIWLRHHSQLQSPTQSEHYSIVKRPLSASLRTADKRLSVQSDSTSTFNFPFLPPSFVPRIPFFNKEATAPVLASPLSAAPEHGKNAVKIELHHEFSFWVLAFLSLWIMCLSIAAVVFWTVFGVPGARPGDKHRIEPATPTTVWETAAQARVLTGLVLGLMVALLGSMAEICLVAGAYILL